MKFNAGEGGGADPQEALLEKIRGEVNSVLEKRSADFKSTANDLVKNALSGLSLDALRSYAEDKTKLEDNIKKIAAGLEKMEQRKSVVSEKRDYLKDLLFDKWDDISKIARSGEGSIALNVRAAAIMTTENVIDYPEEGIPDEMIESFDVGEFVRKRRPRQYVFDIADRRTVSKLTEFKTWLEEGDEEGAFAIVAEGGLKPLVSTSLVRNFVKTQKVAGKQVYTEEVPKFRQEAYNIIRTLINDKLLRDYQAILTSNLLAQSASYVGSALDGQFDNPTDYHAIGAVAAQIEALDFLPDVLIMNPQDKWRIGLSQDTVGQFYLAIPVTDPSGETRMMGFIIRTSNLVPVGTAILGESGLWKIEDEAVQIRIGYGISTTTATVSGSTVVTSVEHDIDHNRFRIIAETFFRNYIATNHLGSYVKFDFAEVKALLQTEEEPETPPIED